ncbi:MAG: hypothetical protein JWN44_126 [Myxococcales bacterium]|nr:hypothetical protein [Myxococcales bacterium]
MRNGWLLVALVLTSSPSLARKAAPPAGARKDLQPFQRGVCYAHAWRGGGYGSDTSAKTLARLRSLGVEWLSLTPFGFMESTAAAEIRSIASGGGESDERMRVDVARAHALGMKVALKPHIWIRHGEWQGDLKWPDEAAWRRWFASYRTFIVRYAELAERDHYDLLVIGTELKSATARDLDGWRALIADVRRAYKGPITYAANWDEAERVGFWSALDFVGIDAYAPIAKKPGSTKPELCTAWNVLAKELEALSTRTGKRIILTEIGYRATRDAAMAPATWPESDTSPSFDPDHQASCYRAAFETLWGRRWLAGIYVWKWFTDSKDEQGPTDFSPADKPAESVMSEFYRRDFR